MTDLRLFEVSPNYQGSPDDPSTELFTDRTGAPLVNLGTPGDPLSVNGATDLALAILEISEGLVVVGNDAGLVFIRSFECIPELPPEVEPACFPEGGAPELALFDSFAIIELPKMRASSDISGEVVRAHTPRTETDRPWPRGRASMCG